MAITPEFKNYTGGIFIDKSGTTVNFYFNFKKL